MASKSTKGLHRTIGLVVDGVQQVGSFAKVTNFSASPDAEMPKTDHLGEEESEVDITIKGWNFSFAIEEEDAAAAAVWDAILSRSRVGQALPRIDLIEIRRYVDPSIQTKSFIYQEAVLKLDSEEASGRTEYNKASWSGACKRRKPL